MDTRIQQLGAFGQSVWIDYISRDILENGTLKMMIDQGVRGMTSNPTIFDKAISGSALYDPQIKKYAEQGKTSYEICDIITIKDIQDAADMFRSVYDQSGGVDGYVSLEINPYCSDDGKETFAIGKDLKMRVNRPNVMFKVPGTQDGNFAIEELTAAGVNVNVTLLFSVEQYRCSAAAYIRGLRRCLEREGDIRSIRSVASIFVSRIDTAVDTMIDEKVKGGQQAIADLRGCAATASCAVCYDAFIENFGGEFSYLRSRGANIQRVLWGSTGTKNPSYSDIKYVTELIGKDTVSTMPQQTFQAFLDHGIVVQALPADIANTARVINTLRAAGIDIDMVCDKLQKDGIDIFKKSFDSLIKSIEQKSQLAAAAVQS